MSDPSLTSADDPWRRVAHLVDDVASILALPDSERSAAFEQLRAAHPQHAEDLRAWEQSARGLEPGAGLVLPDDFGPYHVTRLLGEGGMGRVYEATQEKPVKRRVALKVIKRGMDSHAVLSRFERERQALALMNHDHIARVFDAGESDGGQPYFAMEFVEGEPITTFCTRHDLSTDARLRLFVQVCRGVEHAHRNGIIHRDLKPTNVLVTGIATEPVAKIIDFGLARAADDSDLGGTMQTLQGQIVGTPEYMAPEQANGSLSLDTRTDVYALGVLLYELLVGGVPFSRAESDGSIDVLRQRIIDETPTLPSIALGRASTRGSTTTALGRALRSDLDWVVMRALEKDRERRYGAAGELAADIERFLRCEPVAAGPPSLLYRLRKFTRRYRLQVSAAAFILLAILLGLAGTTWGMIRASRDRAQALSNLQRFDLLSLVMRLADARSLADQLHPATPETAPALRAWLADAGELAALLPRVRDERAAIRARVDAGATATDGSDGRMSIDRFRFLQHTLEELEGDLEAFTAPETGTIAAVTRRLDWATRIADLSIERHRELWHATRRAVRSADGRTASTLYAEKPVDLTPQIGLVPIGMNPQTQLWEFYHLQSAADPTAIPEHASDGSIEIGEDTGIVLVLVPGGTFWMGGQGEDPEAPNYYRLPTVREGPVHRVELDAFFLGRYELTQAQWKRMSGGTEPSAWRAGSQPSGIREITWWNPVHSVTWDQSTALLREQGLVLPTEAQWEYACRAGTQTPWWTGTEPVSLQGAANLSGRTAGAIAFWKHDKELDDRHVVHAPVGSFRANAFGLHDMIGNITELCRDAYYPYGGAVRPGDGLRLPHTGDDPRVPERPDRCVIRGGCFQRMSHFARSADRSNEARDLANKACGVRAARAIDG